MSNPMEKATVLGVDLENIPNPNTRLLCWSGDVGGHEGIAVYLWAFRGGIWGVSMKQRMNRRTDLDDMCGSVVLFEGYGLTVAEAEAGVKEALAIAVANFSPIIAGAAQ